MKTTKQKLLTVGAMYLLFCGSSAVLQAAPLPDGTFLGIDQGVGSATNIPCITGSCFGMEVAPGLNIWTDFGSGTDGGLIVGKNQVSGGQELAPSSANDVPGEVTNVWRFFSNCGTFFTPDGATNLYSDTSCAGADCIGQTELRSWNAAYCGSSVPFGSANGCLSASCSADQLAGILVTEWTIGSPAGSPYTLKYGTVVPDGDPSSFGNVKFSLILRGIESPIPPPRISGLWPADGPPGTFVFVFGENFIEGDSVVQVNGVASPRVQVLDQNILIFMLPEGDTNGPVRVTTSVGSAPSTISFGVPSTGLNISGIWPAAGGPGSFVFLFGTEFVVGNTQVALNGTPVHRAQALDESIVVMMLPTGISSGPFTVTTPTATAVSSGSFTVR